MSSCPVACRLCGLPGQDAGQPDLFFRVGVGSGLNPVVIGDGCSDLVKSCRVWAANSFCMSLHYDGYMNSTCPLSCGLCVPDATTTATATTLATVAQAVPCADAHSGCASLAAIGLCLPEVDTSGYVATQCRQTCGRCGSGFTQPPPTTAVPSAAPTAAPTWVPSPPGHNELKCVENGARDYDCCGLDIETGCSDGFSKVPTGRRCATWSSSHNHYFCVPAPAAPTVNGRNDGDMLGEVDADIDGDMLGDTVGLTSPSVSSPVTPSISPNVSPSMSGLPMQITSSERTTPQTVMPTGLPTVTKLAPTGSSTTLPSTSVRRPNSTPPTASEPTTSEPIPITSRPATSQQTTSETTPSPTTSEPSTSDPTTTKLTPTPTIPDLTTSDPTPAPRTPDPTTSNRTTYVPTLAPLTSEPAASRSTPAPTTPDPTTLDPTTSERTTSEPNPVLTTSLFIPASITYEPATSEPTSSEPTPAPIIFEPPTSEPTTSGPIPAPTTPDPTTSEPTPATSDLTTSETITPEPTPALTTSESNTSGQASTVPPSFTPTPAAPRVTAPAATPRFPRPSSPVPLNVSVHIGSDTVLLVPYQTIFIRFDFKPGEFDASAWQHAILNYFWFYIGEHATQVTSESIQLFSAPAATSMVAVIQLTSAPMATRLRNIVRESTILVQMEGRSYVGTVLRLVQTDRGLTVSETGLTAANAPTLEVGQGSEDPNAVGSVLVAGAVGTIATALLSLLAVAILRGWRGGQRQQAANATSFATDGNDAVFPTDKPHGGDSHQPAANTIHIRRNHQHVQRAKETCTGSTATVETPEEEPMWDSDDVERRQFVEHRYDATDAAPAQRENPLWQASASFGSDMFAPAIPIRLAPKVTKIAAVGAVEHISPVDGHHHHTPGVTAESNTATDRIVDIFRHLEDLFSPRFPITIVQDRSQGFQDTRSVADDGTATKKKPQNGHRFMDSDDVYAPEIVYDNHEVNIGKDYLISASSNFNVDPAGPPAEGDADSEASSTEYSVLYGAQGGAASAGPLAESVADSEVEDNGAIYSVPCGSRAGEYAGPLAESVADFKDSSLIYSGACLHDGAPPESAAESDACSMLYSVPYGVTASGRTTTTNRLIGASGV